MNSAADELLKKYREKNATGAEKYKQIFDGYMQAAKEFTEKTGQPAPEVLFVIGSDVFKAKEGDDGGLGLERINERSRHRSGPELQL